MLAGRVLNGGEEQNGLNDMEWQLRRRIEQARRLAQNCKPPTDHDAMNFILDANGELIVPDFKPEVNYSQRFWKTHLQNQISFALLKDCSEKTAFLQQQVQELEKQQDEYFKMYKIKNRKKNRRLAVEIEKNFTCPYEKCYKIYGSDVSLNLHIKLKHNGGNKTDREKLAEEICKAESKGEKVPEMRLHLPPGYLEEFRQSWKDKIHDKIQS